MTPQTLTCPRCHKALFVNTLIGGSGNDTRTYLELRCATCTAATPTLQFVVDLTPEFERDEHEFSRPAR